MQLVELPSDIPSIAANDTAAVEENCASWSTYYATAPHKQDDSGI